MKRLVIALLIAAAAPAPAPAQTPPENDYGGFRSVLAVGQGEGVNTFELGAYLAGGTRPGSFTSQLPMYRDLLYAEPTLTDADLEKYFKPAGFGVPPGEVAQVDEPRPGVRIVRDRAFRVPQVYGVTREMVMFGAGYAQAQDRMFMMDVLRHTGRGDLSAFAGPGADDANLKADILQLKRADYTEDELRMMIEERAREFGPEGDAILADVTAFTDGINQFIAEARNDPDKMPGEYAAIGRSLEDWKLTDTAAAASLVGARFGLGGGFESANADLLALASKRFGGRRARRVFKDFMRADDPEAPVTVARRFPFDDPGRPRGSKVARLDAGSFKEAQVVESDTGAGGLLPPVLRAGLKLPKRMSSALLVSGRRSRSGRPLAVMGPQIGFYSPAIFMEMALHGPGFDVRGGVFPGVAPYVLIGRGPDYAWSATSAATDNVDEFVSPLCDETHYRYDGECREIQVQRRTLRIDPAPASPSRAPRTIQLKLERTVHGPVQGRATVDGKPVIVSWARSTYMHELDSAIAFKRLNLNEVRDARTFKIAMSTIGFVFNWLYADDRDIAYFQSGWFPRRAKGTNPYLPAWGDGRADWRGFDPVNYTSKRLPARRLPQAINPRQGYLVSWNNKQAPGWRAADDVQHFSSVHRSEILDKPLARLLAGRKATLADLVKIMAAGATVDLRGRELWPVVRRVIGRRPPRDVAAYVELLDAWHADGAHRRDLDRDNVYEHSAAVALMDAWFGHLVRGVFEPALGKELYERSLEIVGLDDHPSQFDPTGNSIEGSVWGNGYFGQLDKDLRAVLGRRVRGGLSRRYCGGGRLRRCRQVVIASLRAAVAEGAKAQGDDPRQWKVPATCESNADGSSPCDQIDFTAAGAVETDPIPLQNRPTFQQVVEVRGHRPR